ncbi:SPOR domain-containing protein [Asticcacaulis machinosus]|uniref:SPOR domain-containing protein n=1 Tax=Asticcacaulis machinosus TaxID=2984211 RepID=A0ABT5HHE3_9CAUL|nr:SPOR domain-containing protein [Asticcacaulis machinosus]MDC7675612.1 SPOR domain-containing protein [Asticcacaulis machinosus]
MAYLLPLSKDLAPLSKGLVHKAWVAGVATLSLGMSACEGPKRDGQDFQRLAAHIQSIQVDETSPALPAKTDPATAPVLAQAEISGPRDDKAINVIVDTARDMAVGQGGLFTQYNNLKVQVVDPLELDRNQPPKGVVLSQDEASETKVIAPPMTFADSGLSSALTESEVKPASQTVNKGRTIQIGSFSTRHGAQAAWDKLTSSHPEMARFNPQMQNVRTNGGKVLVRLKVGPVYTDAEAQVLCAKLDVKDSWCTRAG